MNAEMKTIKISQITEFFEKVRMMFSSRHIFLNWLNASLMYLLAKTINRIDCIKVTCNNGASLYLDPVIYGRIVRGYHYGFLKTIECRDDRLELNGIRINLGNIYKGGMEIYDLGCARFVRYRDSILEIFIKQPYSMVDVKNKTVVDIGAYIGDSSIYFIVKGAERVIAVEPHREAFHEMLKNIRLNNMQGKVIPVHGALVSRKLANKYGSIEIGNISILNTIGIYYSPLVQYSFENTKYKVPLITLEHLIKHFSLEPEVLKMDCEGCEYDVILNDYEYVSFFKELIVEYHYGHRPLLEKLSNDYRCKAISEGKGAVGVLYCISKR